MCSTFQIPFSNWILWENRAKCTDLKSSGVYLIAEFNECPAIVDRLAGEIFYVGETTGRTQLLKTRLSQFEKSAQNGNGNHSGGRKFHTVKGPAKMKSKTIYFSYALSDKDAELKAMQIKMWERICLYDFTRENGKAPCCNSV